MIKQININWLHWVNWEVKFNKRTIIKWESKLWKTTILNAILASYGWWMIWYRWLPEWVIQMITDDWESLIQNSKLVSNISIPEDKADLIKFIMPWMFFTTLGTTWEQRKVITKLLGLNTSLLEEYSSKIKELESSIKNNDLVKSQITKDIIRIEDELNQDAISEPVRPTVAKDNAEEIIKKYDEVVNQINLDNKKIRAEYDLEVERYNFKIQEVNSKYDKTIRDYDIKIQQFSNELLEIESKANLLKSSVDYNCKHCGSLVKAKDNKVEIEELKVKWLELANEKESLKITYNELVKSKNDELIKLWRWPKEPLLNNVPYLTTLDSKAEFVWLVYKPADTTELDKYNLDYKNYIEQKTMLETYRKELELKKEQLKWLSNSDLELELAKYKKLKTDFNKDVEDKVKATWLNIVLFETLKNWNIRETFDIFDQEWFSYYATSTWNKIYIEVLVAKLFIDYLWLDFILIDKWESVWNNLREKIFQYIWDMQLIATQVSSEKTITIEHI